MEFDAPSQGGGRIELDPAVGDLQPLGGIQRLVGGGEYFHSCVEGRCQYNFHLRLSIIFKSRRTTHQCAAPTDPLPLPRLTCPQPVPTPPRAANVAIVCALFGR